MFLLLMRIQGLSLATLVQFSERQDLGRLQRPHRELLLRHDRDPLQGHVLFRRSNKYVNWVEGMNARKLAIVLSFFVITAVCGLVLASHSELRQSRKAAHAANDRADTSSGAKWRWQNPLPQGNNLRGASLVNANTGTLVGDYGTIVRTTDGGNNWTIQSSGTTQTLWGVSFTDANNGSAVGENGTILRTTDGGAHWMPQTSGTVLNLRAVSFTDGNSGTAVGEGGVILKTTNGGSTWVPQSSGTAETLFGVSFSDSNTGTAVGGTFGKSEIFRTTDGGEHWIPQANPGTEFLFDVSFTDTNNGTAVGDHGTILRTTDGGSSWVPQTSGTTKTLYGVSFTDTNNGTVVGFEFGGTRYHPQNNRWWKQLGRANVILTASRREQFFCSVLQRTQTPG